MKIIPAIIAALALALGAAFPALAQTTPPYQYQAQDSVYHPVQLTGCVWGCNTTGAVVLAPTVTITPATTAYAAGYSLGGVQTLTGLSTMGLVNNAEVSLSSGSYSGAIDLILFDAQPGTYADNTAVSLSVADQGKVIAVMHMTDVTNAGGGASIIQAQNTGILYSLANSGTTLYGLMVTRGAVTFAASSSVIMQFYIVK